MRFVDTNVLLYAVSTTPEEADKTRVAREVLSSTDLALSVQVLQEFYVQATRAGRTDPLPPEKAAALIEAWLRFPTQEMTIDVLRAGLASAARYRLSYWDATVIEAARVLACEVVLSEDLSDGQRFHGVRVENPFAHL